MPRSGPVGQRASPTLQPQAAEAAKSSGGTVSREASASGPCVRLDPARGAPACLPPLLASMGSSPRPLPQPPLLPASVLPLAPGPSPSRRPGAPLPASPTPLRPHALPGRPRPPPLPDPGPDRGTCQLSGPPGPKTNPQPPTAAESRRRGSRALQARRTPALGGSLRSAAPEHGLRRAPLSAGGRRSCLGFLSVSGLLGAAIHLWGLNDCGRSVPPSSPGFFNENRLSWMMTRRDLETDPNFLKEWIHIAFP